MRPSLLLSTGEFAQLCNVSKELLIHYDRIGLLKPREIGENGYRYYSLRQLYLFDAIRFFLDAGMSMKEVKDYLDNRTTDLFLETTQSSLEKMRQQMATLGERIDMMEKMRYITQRGLLFPKGKPRLSYWDETWFIATDVKRERTQRVFAEAVSNHSDYCRLQVGVSKFPLGRVVDIPDPSKPEEYYYDKIITWIAAPENPNLFDDRLICKPKGNYAVILHQGGTSSVEHSYERLLSYVKEKGFTAQGPLVELDMNSYLMSDEAEDYLLHISVLVDA